MCWTDWLITIPTMCLNTAKLPIRDVLGVHKIGLLLDEAWLSHPSEQSLVFQILSPSQTYTVSHHHDSKASQRRTPANHIQ